MHRNYWTILLNSIFILILISITAMSAVPPYMNYQGRLTDNLGNPIDTISNITFTLYTDDGSLTELWTETQLSVVVTDGLFQVFLGLYNPMTPDLFDGATRLIGIKLGDGPENTPLLPIVSVAYAQKAGHADTAAYALDAPAAGSPWLSNSNSVYLSSNALNVGIGTSNPSTKLHVYGDVAFEGSASIGTGHTVTGYMATITGGNNNSALGGRAVVGGGTGNVAGDPYCTIGGGLSNIAESWAATVGGGRNNRARGEYSVVSGGGGFNEADSNYATGTGSVVPGGSLNGATATHAFAAGYRAKAKHLGTFVWADRTSADFSSTGANQFLIRASGGVGIGVTSPLGQLDLTDNSSGVALHISNADRDITWTTGQSLQLGEWNGSTFIARMRITAEGNVGINTTAPAGALHVKGNSDGVALHLSAASGDITWPTDNTLNMGTWNGSVFDEHLRITAGGNVGIGVSSTPNILTIQQFSATDPIADSWGTYSSRRWKENIQPLRGALDRVLQLQGVSYDWRETGEHDIGLIAEEVGRIVPEVVQYEENGVDARSVDYARLTTLLIEAVKELKSDNEDLKRRLDAVERVNSEE